VVYDDEVHLWDKRGRGGEGGGKWCVRVNGVV
jgi:hypothetical protein